MHAKRQQPSAKRSTCGMQVCIGTNAHVQCRGTSKRALAIKMSVWLYREWKFMWEMRVVIKCGTIAAFCISASSNLMALSPLSCFEPSGSDREDGARSKPSGCRCGVAAWKQLNLIMCDSWLWWVMRGAWCVMRRKFAMNQFQMFLVWHVKYVICMHLKLLGKVWVCVSLRTRELVKNKKAYMLHARRTSRKKQHTTSTQTSGCMSQTLNTFSEECMCFVNF